MSVIDWLILFVFAGVFVWLDYREKKDWRKLVEQKNRQLDLIDELLRERDGDAQ